MKFRTAIVACFVVTLPAVLMAPVVARSEQLLRPGASAAAWKVSPEMEKVWRKITIDDVNAAYRLLKENHPGAVPEAGDPAFLKMLMAAYRSASGRAGKATSYGAYIATLAGFANSMGDHHIWSRPLYKLAYPHWAGVLVSLRDGRWIITHQDTDFPYDDLMGASLVACDGQAADNWAHDQLAGFRAVWSIEAQRIDAAPWLFVSTGNPFTARAKSCIFEKNGKRHSVELVWKRISRTTLLPMVKTARGGGAAGYGIRAVGSGYWIALQGLTGKAGAVVKAVRKQQNALRNAAFVVLDLRGNHGGSSSYGRQIAESLMGADYVRARLGGVHDTCSGQIWRVSPDNIAQLEYYRDVVVPTLNSAKATAYIEKALADAEKARAAGEPLSGPVDCLKKKQQAATPPAAAHVQSLLRGRMVLLTDHVCFSSCLLVVEDFRKLGALQVGETTNANTHYAEVREELLPSGLSLFSTLEALQPSVPPQIGPYEPAIKYQGNIADTPALELWIERLAAQK